MQNCSYGRADGYFPSHKKQGPKGQLPRPLVLVRLARPNVVLLVRQAYFQKRPGAVLDALGNSDADGFRAVSVVSNG